MITTTSLSQSRPIASIFIVSCGFAQKSKSHLGVVSQFKNYSFLPVMVSEARTILRSGSARASRIHPDNLSLTMPRQGVLPRMRHLLPQKISREKCMEENSLKRHGEAEILAILRLALLQLRRSRAALRMTSRRHFDPS